MFSLCAYAEGAAVSSVLGEPVLPSDGCHLGVEPVLLQLYLPAGRLGPDHRCPEVRDAEAEAAAVAEVEAVAVAEGLEVLAGPEVRSSAVPFSQFGCDL